MRYFVLSTMLNRNFVDGGYLHYLIHRSVVEMNLVDQARLLLFVQVNEEDIS